MSLVDVEQLREIAEMEFADIVVEAFVPDINELRIILTDGSEDHVVESHLSEEPEQALREFLTFARERLKMLAE